MFRPAIVAIAILAVPHMAAAADDLDRIVQQAGIPPGQIPRHGYSDFTDPLGRFMDLLASGAVDDARAIRADACRQWQQTRETSAWTGKFHIWNAEADLNTLCPRQ